MSLADDLNSYLKQSSSSSGSTLSNLSGKLRLPTLKSPFGGGGNGGGTPDDEQPFLENGEGGNSGWFGGRFGSQQQQKPGWMPALSKKQRIFGFMTSLILGFICFGLAAAYVPLIVIKARKFSLLFSLGSLFTLFSFSFLYGPWNHIQHLFSKERLPFTIFYLLSLTGTLYFAMGLQSTILTCIAAVLQVISLVWFVVSYVPGGQTGLKFLSKICGGACRSTVGNSLPV